VVVLVHGFSTSSFVWRGLLPKLTEAGLRVLTYDQYGRGFSDRPDSDFDAAFYERQLLELLSSQGEVFGTGPKQEHRHEKQQYANNERSDGEKYPLHRNSLANQRDDQPRTPARIWSRAPLKPPDFFVYTRCSGAFCC
jgi:hypothetical protein